MTLTAEDQRVLRDMRQRELSLKKRQRAASAIFQEKTRYQRLVLFVTALIVALLMTAAFLALQLVYRPADAGASLITWEAARVLVIGAIGGLLVGAGWLRMPPGRKLVERKEVRLNEKYSGDLHAGRRWQQFYYRGEEISVYIPQILQLVESEHRFDSVDEALAFVQACRSENPRFRDRGLRLFNAVVAQTDLVVLSSADADGRPSSRFMRFVTTDRPGVWYVTSAPDTPKVRELDRGLVSLITAPNEKGEAISSNRVRIRRAEGGFASVAHLYREQVPRYLDGMTDEDQACEVVYELTLESARVSGWTYNEMVVFDDGGEQR